MVRDIRTTEFPSWSYFKSNKVQVVYFTCDGVDMVAIFNNNITNVNDVIQFIKLKEFSLVKEIVGDIMFMTSEKYHRIFR